MTLVTLWLCPLLGAGLLALVRPGRVRDALHLLVALGTAASAVAVVGEVGRRGPVAGPLTGLWADPLSALLVALVAGISLLASLAVPGWTRDGLAAGRLTADRAGRLAPLFHLFVFTMLAAVTTDNVGVMWVAVEGTTLASVFLITVERTRASLEAAYKYLLICSVGIAVAFAGTVLVYYADVERLGETADALAWSTLVAAAPSLPPRLVALAFVFLLVGYGTKAGLVPMHTWLPDAHSEAPAPVSALMSGVLLGVGFYALLRMKAVTDLAVGPAFADTLLIWFGLGSMAVAAAALWAPTNYKRMLAYSSVEHMGLICLGVAFGGRWGLTGALLHLVNHALAKSSLFLLAGRILTRYRSADVARVRGLRWLMPWTGGAFLAATIALIGLPPFGLFLSEILILRAGLTGSRPWVAALALVCLLVAFGGMLRAVHRMLYGSAPAELAPGDARGLGELLPVAVSLLLLLVLGAGLPGWLSEALGQAAAAVQPGRPGR